MHKNITIGDFIINQNSKTFIIAEVSANHLMDYDRAVAIIQAAKDAGADAVKLQTYTPDTITLDCDNEYFQIKHGTIWDGTTLHKLYQEAYTPWEWQPKLKELANELGLVCFSSPFDFSSVDFMEELDMPAYKIASFEINDIPLIRKIAKLHKPIIMSTGIATVEDIMLALRTIEEEGNDQVILLKCTSAYPTPYEDMNIKIIPDMANRFDCLTGLSDHSMGDTIPISAVALGAKVIEKHLTLSRSDGGPDAAFSMEPHEFKKMVENIRIVEAALGCADYKLTEKQLQSKKLSRSLFVAQDIKKGESFTPENVRSVRPAAGLHTKYYEIVLEKKANRDLKKGTPLSFDMIDGI